MKIITLAAVALIALAPTSLMAKGGGHSGGSHGGGHHSSAESPGEHYVHGYIRGDGTYVQGHYQTNPNGTKNDNWSTIGNVNPHTGEPGTKPGDP